MYCMFINHVESVMICIQYVIDEVLSNEEY